MRSIFTKLFDKLCGKTPVVILVFLVLVLSSPWYTIILANLKLGSTKEIHLLNFDNQVITYQINSDRGQLIRNSIPSTVSRLFVNKLTYYSYEITQRYFETFDAKYLFFTGDLNVTKSIQSSGPLYLALLPLVIIGIFTSLVKKRKTILLFLFAPILGAFIQAHYETISRIPALIVLTYFAAMGLVYIMARNRRLAFSLMIIMSFEFIRFWHNFLVHYPSLLR
jgi:hypothetical protein